ncbi:PH domain-containing protein [Gemmatimonadota bacterium]
MMQEISFSAPWGTELKVMTTISVIILVGTVVLGIFIGPHNSVGYIFAMFVLPLSILVISAFFTIRGYVLTGDTLFIRRPRWSSKLDLSELVSAEYDPRAMAGSIRTCGNGGMFCFAGACRNKKLGSYRAFVTDEKLSVVLRFKTRVVVVTPENPEDFVVKINKLRNL